ncbi:MAG TPA: sodium/proline symporter [Myxococcota bacterium]|nr:sodium/proline symporter [Myxococcota bacterium]
MIWKVLGVAAYLLCLVAIGVVASRRMTSARSYFAGDKSFGFWAGAFSARATGESAWLLIGLTGMGALVGVKAFWVVLGEVLGVLGAWALMCGPFKRLTDRYDSITIPDYLESHFGDSKKTLRLVAAVALVVFVTIYVSAQIDATGTAFESFLGLNYYTGALIGFGVVLAYIVSGGFVAVVWSDVFQGTLMFLGLVLLPIVGVVYAGGPAEVVEGLRGIDANLLSSTGGEGWTLSVTAEIIGLSLIGLGFLGSPQIFVRFLSLRSDREVLPGGIVAVIWTLFADSGAVLTGLVGRHLLTSTGQDVEVALGNGAQDVLPMLSELVLPPVLVGLVIAIVLSAIMSTVDSLLVLASSAAIRDVWQKVLHPELPDEALVGLSRFGTAALAACALGVALGVAALVPGRTVFWFVIFGWSGIAATFCPTMILSLGWRGFDKNGALAAMIVGFVSVPLYKFGAPELPGQLGVFFANLGELPPAFLTSMLAGVLVSLVSRK